MKQYFCDFFEEFQLSKSDDERLYLSYVVACVLNALLSSTTVVLNAITIQALRKTSLLQKPLKTLLLSLAVSDLGSGLLCQPFTVALCAKWLQQNNPNVNCTAYTVFAIILTLFSFASFFGVMLISVDRFMAIYLHLRYQELVTYNRVVVVVISVWIFSAFLSLITTCIPANIILVVFAVIGILCMVPTAVVNYKIYVAVRRHRNQIHALQVQPAGQNSEMTDLLSVKKSAHGTFYVYVVSLLCFLPQACSCLAMAMSGENTIVEQAVKGLTIYTSSAVFLNSSLNPIIYCWKMRHIRHAIIDLLQNTFTRRS